MTADGVVDAVVADVDVVDVVDVTAIVDVGDVVELVEDDVDGGDVEVVTDAAVGWRVLGATDTLVCVLEAQASNNGGAKRTAHHNVRREVTRPSRSIERDHDAAVAVRNPLALDDPADGTADLADGHHHSVFGVDLGADALELRTGDQLRGGLRR